MSRLDRRALLIAVVAGVVFVPFVYFELTTGPAQDAMENGTDLPLAEFVGESGAYRVQYAETSEDWSRKFGLQIQEWGYFEDAAQTLSAAYILPKNVNVVFTECEEANAFYSPDQQSIFLCYQLMQALDGQFRSFLATEEAIAAAVWNTMLFVFYHEAGHSMIDMFDLPVTGWEEDAVDQLATLILLGAGAGGRDAALQGASWLSIRANAVGGNLEYWDTHSLGEQRYYNIICWIYGSDPDTHGELLKSWGLPQERAASCPAEYARMNAAWMTILAEHIREQ